MDFSHSSQLETRKAAGLLAVPFWKESKKAEYAATIGKLSRFCKAPLASGDFTGKEGEVLVVYADDSLEKRIALVGLGEKDKLTTEKLRRSYSNLVKECLKRKIQDVNILLPAGGPLAEEFCLRGIAEGLCLANYVFTKLKKDSVKEQPPVLIKSASLIGLDAAKLSLVKKAATLCEGVYFARDLVNSNADEVTPLYLAKVAQNMAKNLKNVKTTVFSKKQIEKEKMGLILAVSRGAPHDPAFILVEYKGAPRSKDHTVIVGKGVTYDTGGLNLKPTGSMETMKCDMSGAAAVLGVLYAASSLNLKVNLTGVIPSVENAISGTSYKPGDVYTSYAGKTVEIGNTDAEGRLILADALAYACKHLKPSRIIDLATLTGAIEIALGAEATGLFSNHDALADSLIRSGSETFERVWRMPLYEEYRDQLKSDIADIKNTGGRPAGSITASLFLQEFVDKAIPWAHLDIAATAYYSEGRRYHPKFATGVGVRLLIDFLEQL